MGHWWAGARELAVCLTRDPSEASGPEFGTDLTERLDASEQGYLASEAFSARTPTAWRWTCSPSVPSRSCCWPGSPVADLTEREAILALPQGQALDTEADGLPSELRDTCCLRDRLHANPPDDAS